MFGGGKKRKLPLQLFNRRERGFIWKMCLSHVELKNFQMDKCLYGNSLILRFIKSQI